MAAGDTYGHILKVLGQYFNFWFRNMSFRVSFLGSGNLFSWGGSWWVVFSEAKDQQGLIKSFPLITSWSV